MVTLKHFKVHFKLIITTETQINIKKPVPQVFCLIYWYYTFYFYIWDIRNNIRMPLIGDTCWMTDNKEKQTLVFTCSSSYILRKDLPPQYEHCQCILTICHILVECNHFFAQERKDIFCRKDVVESFRFHPALIVLLLFF